MRKLDQKEKVILDERAFQTRVLFFRKRMSEKIPPGENFVSDFEKKTFINEKKRSFLEKLNRLKINEKLHSMFVDKFSRNTFLVDPTKNNFYFQNDLNLNSNELQTIRTSDEVYNNFKFQMENFVFVVKDLNNYDPSNQDLNDDIPAFGKESHQISPPRC